MHMHAAVVSSFTCHFHPINAPLDTPIYHRLHEFYSVGLGTLLLFQCKTRSECGRCNYIGSSTHLKIQRSVQSPASASALVIID